jgi:hypothetical protein
VPRLPHAHDDGEWVALVFEENADNVHYVKSMLRVPRRTSRGRANDKLRGAGDLHLHVEGAGVPVVAAPGAPLASSVLPKSWPVSASEKPRR